jgi:thiol:disulfide interchange protein DsbD
MDKSGGALPKFRAVKQALGVVAVVAGIALGAGAWSGMRAARTAEGGLWPTYSDAALQGALAARQPVVMDFSASWCAECRELEHKTFSDAKVQKALGPFQKLRVDLDGANISQASALQKRWKVSGLPAIVFVDASGQEVPAARVGGFIPPEEFLSKVELVTPKVAAR